MGYQLECFGTELDINPEDLERRIERLLDAESHRYQRLWMYYRNPMQPRLMVRDEQGSDRPYRQAQEWGLPSRVTGFQAGASIDSPLPLESVARKEVVIENDIGWRVDTMVDFLFGKPIAIGSLASDPDRRRQIEQLLSQIFSHNGGTVLLQQIALLGAVHGFVDVLVKLDQTKLEERGVSNRDAARRPRESTDRPSILSRRRQGPRRDWTNPRIRE